MNFLFEHHRTLADLQVGCEAPRAYFIPYQSAALAIEDLREESDRLLSLCGEWSFCFCRNEGALPAFTDAGFDPALLDRIQVPKSWQMELDRNYDKPQYVNHRYPFPVDPPHIPLENPCGLYVKDVFLEHGRVEGQEIFLNFEGVDSCFYLFVNGCFVAYSEVSHRTSEICVTPYLKEGQNRFCVVVFKWCTGSYLEGQDKYRLSGIFREVYLLFRPRARLRDIQIMAIPDANLTAGCLQVDADTVGGAEVRLTLLSPLGECVAQVLLPADSPHCKLTLDKIALWCDEAPMLYTLLVTCNGEYMSFPVGFRSVVVRDRVVYLNGKPIKAKGVNRHDFHPKKGAAVDLVQMQRELYLMKAHNINMVRTSHYPNDPRFLRLCDKLGLYLCNEADLECHGMFRSKDKHASYADPEWSRLSDSPEWSAAYLNRAVTLLERDKNHPSVILWSVGNESGMGDNHRAMADYFHRRISGALVQADGATRNLTIHLTSSSVPPQAESPACDYTDIDARMYVSPKVCVENFINNPELKSPFWLCEHSHAMGNSAGCLEEYWQTIYAHDRFFGGCVWEFGDHSVNIGTEDASKYTYGGDFGETLHDGNFCVDGLVSPDRTPHSSMLEYKQVLRPVRAVGFDPDRLCVTLRNLRYFCNTSDLELAWELQCNGERICGGVIPNLEIKPQQELAVEFPCTAVGALDGCVYLNLQYLTNQSHPWCPIGYEVGHEQFAIPSKAVQPTRFFADRTMKSEEDAHEYRLICGELKACICKHSGLLTSFLYNGKELLAEPMSPSIWRAPIDNDRYIKSDWSTAGYDAVMTDCRATRVCERTDDCICIESELMLGRAGYAPYMRWVFRYCMTPEGLTVESRASLAEGMPELPRFGVVFLMPSGYEKLRYFGKGATDAYVDKCQAATVGVYDCSVTEHFEHYVRPQENMAHAGTRWAMLTDAGGDGLLCLNTAQHKQFSFNCSHYTDAELTQKKHDFELCPIDETVVHLDLCQRGIGSESCGLPLNESWRIRERELFFSVRLLPVKAGDDPFAYIFNGI